MKPALAIKLQPASLPLDLKGRKTVPSVGIDSSAFVYVPAIKTDIAESFRKARERMREEVS